MLPNNGRTQYFNFTYDPMLDMPDTLRGEGLAGDMMTYCDDDFALLKGWFSGRGLDMSFPINVSLTTVATDSAGNPTQYVGGKWIGGGPWPLQVTINIGQLAMASGTPLMLARYLLVAEVSEMFMRAFAPYTLNPWFASGEGSKGEGLSRFLGQQFLLQTYPGIASIPSLTSGKWNVTELWLNSARINYIESNPDDSQPDDVTGCATLFLFYLHDQLGFRIEDIINAGAGTLSNVYENLTQLKFSYIDPNKAPPDVWQNAWPKFSSLVNAHYPANVTLSDGMKSATTSMMYKPPLDTIFPCCELDYLFVPAQATWVLSGTPNLVTVGLDRESQVPLPITFVSSDPTIISSLPVLPAPQTPPASTPPPVTISPPSASVQLPLTVIQQVASFMTTSVTLTASYAGKSLQRTIVVVRPDSMGLPPLQIDTDRSTDICQRFVENTPQTFHVMNLDVFADQSGLVFSWSVTGAVPDATNTPSLTISALPVAGTTVTINVTVTNAQNLQAAGTVSFQTAANDLAAMTAELHCRITHIVNGALSLPPWVPIEKGGILKEGLIGLEKQLSQVANGATRVTTLIKEIRKFEGGGARE